MIRHQFEQYYPVPAAVRLTDSQRYAFVQARSQGMPVSRALVGAGYSPPAGPARITSMAVLAPRPIVAQLPLPMPPPAPAPPKHTTAVLKASRRAPRPVPMPPPQWGEIGKPALTEALVPTVKRAKIINRVPSAKTNTVARTSKNPMVVRLSKAVLLAKSQIIRRKLKSC